MMSSSRRHYKHDDFDIESSDRYKKERHRSRSRSRSRSRNRDHRHHEKRVASNRSSSRSRRYSRSRSRSLEERRRQRHKRPTRSRSSSRYSSRRERKHTSTRRDRRDSRSRSGSRSHSNAARRNKPRSSSRSPFNQSRESAEKTQDERYAKPQKTGQDGGENSNSIHTVSSQVTTNLDDLPLPEAKRETPKGAYYDLKTDEPIDKERIHREIEEKLRQTLAKEGKVYPPPKQEASHPVFANDGSFLEIFKKMQQQQQHPAQPIVAVPNNIMPMAPVVPAIAAAITPKTAPYVAATALGKSAPPPPIVGRRRGGKILKTGVVAKPKPQPENNADPKDFWSLYLAEINKYKTTACESDTGTRPLVK